MSAFFLDSSALVKRYLTETGSGWVLALADPAGGHAISIAELTQVEVAAALAARYRAPGGITRAERDAAVGLLARHCAGEYTLVPASRAILDRAVDLTQRHRLRGYDVVHWATALAVEASLRAARLPGPTFVAADLDLVAAARAEGLGADDPNLHP